MDELPKVQKSSQRKSALRHKLAKKRKQRALSAAHEDAVALSEQLMTLPELKNASVIGLYWPMGDEINPALFSEHPDFQSRMFVWPRTSQTTSSISFHRPVSSCAPGSRGFLRRIGEIAKPGPFGILEPCGQEVNPSQIDLIIAPGLGFDRHGTRMGYGGGYYDRFLSQSESSHIIVVGVGFDVQCVDIVPKEPHDRPIQYVVTPSNSFKTALTPYT